MAWKTVDKYNLGYDVGKNQFYFYYSLKGESVVHQIFPSPEVFIGLADMFRNERTITFDTDKQYFTTAPEAVGEGAKKSAGAGR